MKHRRRAVLLVSSLEYPRQQDFDDFTETKQGSNVGTNMMELGDFRKIFNRSFWRAFDNLPVQIISPTGRKSLVDRTYKSIKDRTYYPSTPAYYLIKNKGKGVARVVPVFTAMDYIVYFYCIIRLEPIIAINRTENTFGGWSVSGLAVRAHEEDELKEKKKTVDQQEDEMASWLDVSTPDYSFNPFAWSKIYGDFNAKLYATLNSNQYKYYIEFDISNFYDSVRLDILERKIRQRFDREFEDDVSLLFHFLQYWNRHINHYNNQSVGIPQDAMNDCSRILANFYLQEYDKYVAGICASYKATYLRYADDQFLFSNSKEDLELLLFKASKRLKSVGLSLNQEKVRTGTVKELLKYRSFDVFNIIANDIDKKNPSKVESFVDEYLKLLDKGDVQKIKKKGVHILNRALFCSIESLPLAKKTRLLSEYLKDTYLLDAGAGHFERIYSLLSTDAERTEFIKLLDGLAAKAVHNFFHHQLLVFYRKRGIDARHIEKRIELISQE